MGLDKDNNHFSELVSRAYKKLKSYAYYDKNAFYLKTTIAEFESDQTVDVFLKEFAVKLQNRDYSTRDTGAPIVLPKKVDKGNGLFFSNVPLNPTIKKIQCFTPMSIEDGIIAVLWVMTVGFKIDKGLLEEAYGNRVNKSHDSWSPHLFKPFPFQYSSWRDNGVKAAIRCVEDGKSCAFINTDFSAFFYNLYLEESVREKIVSNYCEDELESYLTKLVFGFIDAYSKDHFGGNVLPIGYPPSNVLSNYLLSGFDRRIHDNLLPEYYGRYVDDIILVVRFNPEDALKLESPSELLWRELKKAGFNVKFSEQDAQPTNTLVMCLPNSKL